MLKKLLKIIGIIFVICLVIAFITGLKYHLNKKEEKKQNKTEEVQTTYSDGISKENIQGILNKEY